MKQAPRIEGSAPSMPDEDWLIQRLKDAADASAYLEAVIREGDQAAILRALRQVAQAHGLAAK